MKKKWLIVFGFVISLFSVHAGDKAIAEEVMSRILIVKTLTEDAKVLKSLKKNPSLLASYKKNIKESNSYLKEVVEKFWDINATKLYKTGDEIEQLQQLEKDKKKKDRQKYVVLYLRFFSERFQTREESAEKTDLFYTGDASYLHLDFWEGESILYTSSPRVIPTKSDFVFMVRNLYHQVIGMEFNKDLTELCKENGPQVRDKILLLTEKQAEELKEKDLTKAYKYQYKIVDLKTIDQAIVSSDSKYVCVISADQSDTVVLKYLYLTGSGKIAGYFTDVNRPPLTKKDFKEMCKYCD